VVAHSVSVMVIQASAAEDGFTDRPEQARQALRDIEAAGRSALGELRWLLRAFRDEEQYEEEDVQDDGPGQRQAGLARLDELVGAVRAAGLSVVVRQEGPENVPAGGVPPTAVDLTAYRIIQEALTNTLRHGADADEVRVSVRIGEAAVDIEVVDNGRPRELPARAAGSGRGLAGMRERVALLGGSLRAGPLDGGGWGVHARLPMEGDRLPREGSS
jgi:signal transduction histidine kinase